MHIDTTKVKTHSLKERKSKVVISDFAKAGHKNISFSGFYKSLPDVLAARQLRCAVDAIVRARKKKKPVIFMMGAHVIKCGLSPLIIDLVKKKVITCIALNGAGIIHDFELSFCGNTSEDVKSALDNGSFGMSKDTADFLNSSITEGNKNGLGAGEAVGLRIDRESLRFKRFSILYNCFKLGVPVTVHIALGTDIIHQHPSADGASIGEASLRDFRKLSGEITRLGNGGVVANIGSAVILPEIFLKALNLARNLGNKVEDFTTVNFDMLYQYRPWQNVVSRPPLGDKAKGYYIIGHHEIMVPFLYQAILEKL